MEKWETSEDFGGRESCTESEDEVAGKWTDGKIERISRRSVTWQKDELLTEDSKGKKEPKRMIEIIEKVRKTGREVTSEASWNWTVRHRSKIIEQRRWKREMKLRWTLNASNEIIQSLNHACIVREAAQSVDSPWVEFNAWWATSVFQVSMN